MINIPKELSEEIYNELVCYRKMKEIELSKYIISNYDENIDKLFLDTLKDSIKETENLYKKLGGYIYE